MAETHSMDGSVQRHLYTEFGEAWEEEYPVYLPGDTIYLRLRVSHEVNLGGVWALLRRLPRREMVIAERSSYYPEVGGKHYRLSGAGGVRVSELCFEIGVSRERHLPGEYELEAVRAYPYELDGREDMILEFEIRDRVRFRIADELGSSPPRVTGWKLE
jgi:hypothetical protein